jgi:glycosyltransferase involved in cell wall biosynthesis
VTPLQEQTYLVTAIVLTKNEEKEIGACLSAIPIDIPRIVIDCGSTDATTALARAAGAQVHHRNWTGFADQRNFALNLLDLNTDWVLFVDADERYSATFFNWMRSVIAHDPPVDAYQVPSVLFLDGTPLRYAPGYPIFHPRLVRRTVTFQPNHAGHGETLAACRTQTAPFGYHHYFHSGSLRPWLQRHLDLAQHESDSRFRAGSRRGRMSRSIPAGPGRAGLRFLYHYIFRLGFLDGRKGLRYALMYAWYELAVYLASDRE